VVERKIYIIGGVNPQNNGAVSRVDIYEPSTNTWTTDEASPMPTSRMNMPASAIDGTIYVIGGWGNNAPQLLSTVEAYTPGEGGEEASSVSPQGKLTTTWSEIKRR